MKILIVEDDPMVTHINIKFANKAGYDDVESVADIEGAKERLSRGDIDLVLLDIYFPVGKGIEILIWIRNRGLKTDVILITADRSAETVETAMNYGAVDYLIKPFDFERFKTAMDKYISKINGISGKVNVEQNDIDALFLDNTKKDIAALSGDFLEKGMSEKTYITIFEAMQKSENAVTSEELGDRLGISRVSVRRYLEFMESKGILELKLIYGKKGRPQHLFKYIEKSN